jgi:hypothetical protein
MPSAASVPLTDLETPPAPRARPHRWIWVSSLVVVVAVVAAAVAVTGRHSTKSPLAVLSAASARTTASRTARTSMVETISTNGISLEALRMSGTTDWARKASTSTMSSRGKSIMEIRQVAGVSYLATGMVPLPGGARWIAIRPSDAKLSGGQSPLGTSDPNAGLQYLSAIKGNPRVVGKETIAGTDTTHYVFTIDLQAFFARMAKASKSLGTGALGSSLGQLARIVDLTKVPSAAWIDGRGRVRQFEFTIVASQGGQTAKVSAVISYSHFDEPVSISAPPASETIPFSQFPDFYKQLGSKSNANPLS